MNDQTIDLYALFNLDREATSRELGLLVLARDADLENKGVPATDHRRRQLETAYGVLSEEATRRTYDDALGARLQLTWPELEHLGSFGELPDANLFPGSAQSPGQSPGQPQSQSPFGYPMGTPSPPTAAYPGSYPGGPGAVGSTAASSFGYPTGPVDYSSQVPAQQYGVHPYPDRPSAGLRLGMMLLDSLAAVSVAVASPSPCAAARASRSSNCPYLLSSSSNASGLHICRANSFNSAMRVESCPACSVRPVKSWIWPSMAWLSCRSVSACPAAWFVPSSTCCSIRPACSLICRSCCIP